MGAWGCGPLDNDNAADWFGGLFDDTGFREHVAKGLASGNADVSRAAAWIVARLGQVGYVWPIEHLDEDRILAAAGLVRLQQNEDWLELWGDSSEVLAELDAQLEDLELSPAERKQAKQAAGSATTKKKATKKKATKKKATKKKVTKKKATKKKTTRRTAPKAKSPKGWTRFEFRDAKSNKFWAIRVAGPSHTVHYGRLGTTGQKRTKSFSSHEAAQAAAHKLITQKRKKGYR